jgi:hypothetical protein
MPGHFSVEINILRAKIEKVAASGRLRLPVEQALDLFHSIASGTILRLLENVTAQEDPLWRNGREAALSAIIAEAPPPSTNAIRTAAISLQAGLEEIDDLSPGERLLMRELLGRISSDK